MVKSRYNKVTETLIQVLCVVLLLALLVGILTVEAMRRSNTWQGVVAEHASVYDTLVKTGYIFRDETIVSGGCDGPASYNVGNGSSVSAGDAVATVYAGDMATGTREAAESLIAEIERLRRIDNGAIPDYYGAYAKMMRALSANIMPNGNEAADTLFAALDLYAAQGESKTVREERIAMLQTQFAELVNNHAASVIHATSNGTFYRETDGYESVFDLDLLSTLTPGGLRALLASPQDASESIGKVIVSHAYYLVLPVLESEVTFTVGHSYDLTFTRFDTVARMTLERVSASDADGTVLLIFCGEDSKLPAMLARSEEVAITTNVVEGLRVPMTALREEDGEQVVYVAKDGVAVRRLVDTVWCQNGDCLVAPREGDAYLQANEVIAVTTRRIYEGKALT